MKKLLFLLCLGQISLFFTGTVLGKENLLAKYSFTNELTESVWIQRISNSGMKEGKYPVNFKLDAGNTVQFLCYPEKSSAQVIWRIYNNSFNLFAGLKIAYHHDDKIPDNSFSYYFSNYLGTMEPLTDISGFIETSVFPYENKNYYYGRSRSDNKYFIYYSTAKDEFQRENLEHIITGDIKIEKENIKTIL